MDKIVIDPHNCSREEYSELQEYLNNEAWDYEIIKWNTEEVNAFKAQLGDLVSLIEDGINKMPQKGLKSTECQKTALLNALNEFSYNINGIEASDLEPNEYSE